MEINRRLSREGLVLTKKPKGGGIYELLDVTTGETTLMREPEVPGFARKLREPLKSQ